MIVRRNRAPLSARSISLRFYRMTGDPIVNSSMMVDDVLPIADPWIDYEKLGGDRMGETSEAIRTRVQVARNIQQICFSKNGSSDIICNADMCVGEIRQFCKLQDEGVVLSLSKYQSLMWAAMTQLNLLARAYHRTRSVKLTRTIADLAEALKYRPKLMIG